MALNEIRRDIEKRLGRKLKGLDDCMVVSCKARATHVYRRPDEMDCSGYRVSRLCASHAEGASRINSGIGTITPITRRSSESGAGRD